ncbi:MAG: phosphoglycerate dehydrogenase [Bacteroidetes bacterium QS_9_68_14]|nr:MAG: phosphoglycerate dehydrogenase [Bacteroidetes bacterium QS_9_68_14]
MPEALRSNGPPVSLGNQSQVPTPTPPIAVVVLITDKLDPVCHRLLEEAGHEPRVHTDASPDELEALAREAHGWITRSGTDITAELLEAAEHLQVIGRAGVGVDNIDLEAATRRGILVCNAPRGNTLSAAEHTCALMLATARQVPAAARSLREGAWERKKFAGTELFEKTLGVIGVGKIGRRVAARLEGFEMEVLGYDPYLSDEAMERLPPTFVTKEELLERSDFVTVHTPKNEETRGLVGEEELATCREGAFVVNCARGGIVDEAALLGALESGHLGGAAVDVYPEEPPSGAAREVIEHPKVVATPHIAASTGEAQEKVARRTARQVIAVLKGEAVSSPVNGMGLRMAAQPEARPYLRLADVLGQIVSQLSAGRLRGLTMGCHGEVPPEYAEVLRVAALRGVLAHQGLDGPVNLVNAPTLARERDLRVKGERDPDAPGSFTRLLEVEATFEKDDGEGEMRSVAGTLFDESDPRLVRVGTHDLELRPEGALLFYENEDRPGMLAAVGRILADANVNIATLALSRPADGAGGPALTAINTDEAITQAVRERVAATEGVQGVRAVEVV